MSERRGLPTSVRMRHDSHYVDDLASHRPTPVGRMIALDKLEPNPEQPRVDIGDLTELTASVREKGVLEPLLVKPSAFTGRWMIIAGERRWRAAKAAGLREVACIELDVDDAAVAEIALIENMQRKDLTPWEEAEGLKALCERFGYTHEEVARKVGKSRSSVTEALSIAGLPGDVKERCRRADINTKSTLLQIVRQPDRESMDGLLEKILERGMTRDEARKASKVNVKVEGGKQGGKRSLQPYVFRYAPAGREYKLEIRFRKARVTRAELREVLAHVIGTLES